MVWCGVVWCDDSHVAQMIEMEEKELEGVHAQLRVAKEELALKSVEAEQARLASHNIIPH